MGPVTNKNQGVPGEGKRYTVKKMRKLRRDRVNKEGKISHV